MKMKVNKIGFIFKPEVSKNWWKSHAMAPAPILYDDNTIRIYMGCWSSKKISRIGYIDVDINNPKQIKKISDNFILDIGRDGCFDENGVFPGHAFNFGNGKIHLYYTGFQLGQKVRHYNFGGLAISEDGGDTFIRYSEAPIMDRSDEGLFVRAGQSIEKSCDAAGFHVAYSAGSSWHMCNDELRPVYDVFHQFSKDGIELKTRGTKIVACNLDIEHGLGRPQIIKLGEYFYIFYTRRIIKDMKYFIGAARSKDCQKWERVDNLFDDVKYGGTGEFDFEMIYFPAAIRTSAHTALIFYSGNYFGAGGLGAIQVNFE